MNTLNELYYFSDIDNDSLDNIYCDNEDDLYWISGEIDRFSDLSRNNTYCYKLSTIYNVTPTLHNKINIKRENLNSLSYEYKDCDWTIDGTPGKERIEENKMEKINTIKNKIANETFDYASNYILNHIKYRLGKDYTFSNEDNELLIKDVINKFIKKYDKNYKHHTQSVHTNRGDKVETIINKKFVVVLEKDTFMYIAAGCYVNNKKKEVDDHDLYLYIFGKHIKKYIKELNNIIDKTEEDNNNLYIYHIKASSNEGRERNFNVLRDILSKRDMSTLFYSNNEKEDMCKHIDKFLENRNVYKERQLLYKTGILLYGDPGKGKSSAVKALATKYNRNIVNIPIDQIDGIDIQYLANTINVDDKQEYIILLEDIDTLFLNRDDSNATREDGNTINKLLQFLDSNTSPTNVIFIATTNHIDRLDEALLRDGRFDLKLEVKGINHKDAINFCKSFNLSDKDTKDILDELDKEENNSNIYSQSKLQNRILSRIK